MSKWPVRRNLVRVLSDSLGLASAASAWSHAYCPITALAYLTQIYFLLKMPNSPSSAHTTTLPTILNDQLCEIARWGCFRQFSNCRSGK